MDDFPTVLSDGKTMAICYGDSVYLCRDFYLKSTAISVDRPQMEFCDLLGEHRQCFAGRESATIDLSIGGVKFELIPREELKIGKDLFNNLTVNELLNLIKTKLKQRK